MDSYKKFLLLIRHDMVTNVFFSINAVLSYLLTSGKYSATSWWTMPYPCSPIFLGRVMNIGTPTISPPVSVTVVGKCNRMVPSFPLTNILCGIPSLILRSVNPISSSGLKNEVWEWYVKILEEKMLDRNWMYSLSQFEFVLHTILFFYNRFITRFASPIRKKHR